MPTTTTVVTPAALVPVVKAIPGSYTLTTADLAGNVILAFDSSSAVTLTVPTSSAIAPASVDILVRSTGQVTITAASGVTILAADSALKTRVRYSAATLLRTATNTWHASGDLVA